MEVYGAAGGKVWGGKGGYVKTILSLPKCILFIVVGGEGVWAPTSNRAPLPGGYNGGGASGGFNSTLWYAESGGGSSDIRLDVDDIEHRIVVAGAGGGGCGANGPFYGGAGGNLEGGWAARWSGGRIIRGGDQDGANGTFLYQGMNSPWQYGQSWGAHGIGAGGGGYYGGASSQAWNLVGGSAAGAGGSSYADTSFCKEVEMQQGVRSGDGFIRITVLDIRELFIIKSEENILTYKDTSWHIL